MNWLPGGLYFAVIRVPRGFPRAPGGSVLECLVREMSASNCAPVSAGSACLAWLT